MALTLKEVQQFLEEQKAAPEVVAYLEGVKKTAITPETATAFLDAEEGKKLLQPRLDSHFTKGLETWKAKTFPGVLEEEIKKRFPDETKEQKEMRQVKEELAAEKKERIRASLKATALSFMTTKALPVELVDFVIGDDEDKTNANLATIEKVWNSQVQALVEKKFKDGGFNPKKKDNQPPDLDTEIAKAEAAKDWGKAIALKNQKAAQAAQK